MEPVRIVNLSFQLWGSITSLLIFVCLWLQPQPHSRQSTLYGRMLLTNTGVLLMDALALYFRLSGTPMAYVGVRATNFLAFALSALLCTVFVRFLTAYLTEGGRTTVSPWYVRLGWLFFLLQVGLLLLNLFFPFLYGFDGENRYHRLPLYPLSSGLPYLTMALGAVALIRHRRALSWWERLPFVLFLVLPTLLSLGAMLHYGIVFAEIGSTLALTTLFLYLVSCRSRRAAQQETALIQSRMALMRSQIQPHFIFNALNSIEYLCSVGSPDAATAVNHFAAYLHENLEGMETGSLIPFSKELLHTKNYLYIEGLRFPDITVQFHCPCTEFLLPPLTLQPLVENAVKHGLRAKLEDPWIHISTRETDDTYLVLVEDNGCGFDPEATLQDGRVHIGLQNVRSRLAYQCQGTLLVDSTPGSGTRITLQIPKAKP